MKQNIKKLELKILKFGQTTDILAKTKAFDIISILISLPILKFFQKWPKNQIFKKIRQNFFFGKMCAIRSNFNILSSSFLQTSLF